MIEHHDVARKPARAGEGESGVRHLVQAEVEEHDVASSGKVHGEEIAVDQLELVSHAVLCGGVPKLFERCGVLIDGNELATMMIDYGIGVTEVASYTVQRVDSDYFEEE